MSAYRDEDPRIHDIKTRIRVVPNFPKPGIMFQDITTLLLNPKAFKDTIDLFVERYKGKNISVVAGSDLGGLWLVMDAHPVKKIVASFAPEIDGVLRIRSAFKCTLLCPVVWALESVSILLCCRISSSACVPRLVSWRSSLSNSSAGIEARGFIFGPPIALAIGAKFVPLRKPRKLPGEVISEKYILEYGRDCLEMHVGAVKSGERALVVDDLIATGGTLCAAMNLLERAGAEVVECACVIELPDLKVLPGKLLFPCSVFMENRLEMKFRMSRLDQFLVPMGSNWIVHVLLEPQESKSEIFDFLLIAKQPCHGICVSYGVTIFT
ncbi:hypothetical protein POTOM_004540 [Populus tomentosa]|uniref:adenine phosphoribosyltransferase n=1 Tax=Populus tomentosa TaxID=118781 RepID=A0A8X8AFB3_POPTO|nr:hypothetical protein POTOM_004540 [Populus tomentosa]